MKSLATSLIAGSLVVASAARGDIVQFPPDRALPDVLYYIGAESGLLNSNEFGDQYWPDDPASNSSPKAKLPIADWQRVTPAHSRWSSASGYPGYSYYFHVEHGMHTPGTSDEKSEVQLPFSAGPGQDFYFGISILMPTGYVSVSRWNLFFQLHSSMVLGSLVGLDTSPGMWKGVSQSALGVHYQSGDAHYEVGDSAMGLACGASGCPAVHAVVAGKPTYYFEKFADNSPGTWNDIILHVKLSSFTRNITLNPDGILEVWHRKAGGSWATNPIVTKTGVVLGVTYSPKGMVADTYPRVGLYRDTWCQNLTVYPCVLDTTTGPLASRPAGDNRLVQPPEEIYLDNIVLARTLNGAKSVFPAAADTGF